MADSARIEELRRRLDREPSSRLFAQLAEELRKGGEQAEAARVARQGLAQHPGYTSARLTLARALLELGEFGAARGELETVLRAAPDNILASRLLGDCLIALGDLGSALLQLRATVRLSGGDRAIEAQISALELRLHGGGPSEMSEVAVPSALQVEASAEDRQDRADGVPGSDEPDGESRCSEVGLDEPPVAADSTPPSLDGGGGGGAAPWVSMGPVSGVLGAWDDDGQEAEPPKPGGGERGVAGGLGESLSPPELEPAVERRGEVGPSMSSPTLAELYFQQGSPEKALDVYRELLDREPGNERARTRLAQIEALVSAEENARDPQERKRAVIARLEQWLGAARGVGREGL